MKCQLCGRENELNFHHLIPTSQHSNKWFKKNHTSEQLQKGIYICEKDCHSEIHKLIPEKEMGLITVQKNLEKLRKVYKNPTFFER